MSVDLGRRSFFKKFAAATAGAMALGVTAQAEGLIELVDPEKELWVPGAKTFIDLHAPTVLRPDADADLFARTLNGPTNPIQWPPDIARMRSREGLPVLRDFQDKSDPYDRRSHDRLYDPFRYTATVMDNGSQVDMTFDSDWKLQRAIDQSDLSRNMTMDEQRALARRVFESKPAVKMASLYPYAVNTKNWRG